MRNLKRVLSLALALVMVLGMMVIGTSAATFTDADEITYTEAVEVMEALGILQGYNGEFNPKGNLNRAGAAKLIAFMTMGAEADDYLAGSAAPFADVAADHWAAKYVAYCSNLKIIDGNGDGTFNPDGNISVVGFAKLVLGAAGIAGEYTGANWENNVKNAVAATPELKATGIKVTTANITREEAAALMLAGMKAGGSTTIYYDVVVDDDVKATFTDIVDAYVMNNIVGGEVETRTETTGALLDEVYGVNYIEDDEDAYGNPGVGYEKTVDGKKVIDLFYGEEAALTYTKDMDTVAGKKAIKADLKALGVTVDADDEDRFSNTSVAIVDGGDTVNVRKVASLAAKTGENAVVKVYVENKAVTLITVVNTYASTVESVTEAEGETPAYVTLANTKTFDTEAFAEDDVVLYTLSAGEVETLVKAEAVTGTLTSYTKDGKYTIGGKVYEMSTITGVLSSAGDVVAAMGKEMVYSLDANGKIVAVAEPGKAPEVTPVITDYAIVMSANGKVKTTTVTWPTASTTYEVSAQLQVLLSNGSVEIWDLAILEADKAIANTSIAKGDFYYLLGKTPVEVAFTGADDDARSAALTADIAADFSGIYTYADKALVARVVTYTGAETKDATIQLSNGTDLDKGVYTFGSKDVILNDKTVFVLKELKADGSFKGYTVKTGVAALENTVITDAFKAVVAVTAGKNQDGEADASKNVYVANVIFAETTAFRADTSVNTTDEYALVDGNYVVTVDGTDEYRTYSVTYADGTTGSVVVKNEEGDGMTTGAYKLKADGSIDNTTGITTTKTVKLVSGTTVIFTDGSAMTTNAKTVVVGGELAAEAEAYVVGTGSITIAFIVE